MSVLVRLLDTFCFWLLTPPEVFDISETSSFNPWQAASQFRFSRSFLSEATVQLCHRLTRTVYQNIKYNGLQQKMTKFEECKAAIIKFNHRVSLTIFKHIRMSIPGIGYRPLPSRDSSIERSSQSNKVPTNMVRQLQWVFPKINVPPNHQLFSRVFHYQPSILGFFPLFLETSSCLWMQSHKNKSLAPTVLQSPMTFTWK